MNEPTIAELIRLYGLGTALASPTRVSGGLLHRIYHLQTTWGAFAVKCLNPTIMGYANIRETFRRSERIATAIQAAGISAVTALSAPGDEVLHDIGDDTILLYPWIDALPARPPISAGPERARRIGSTLGRIHSLPLHFADMPLPALSIADADTKDESVEWESLAEEAERQNLAFAAEVRALLPKIAKWIHQAHEAREALRNPQEAQNGWVISHGDLDQKNVLWADEQTPYLIDWESAGYVQPVIEAIGTALDWSGQVVGDLDEATFVAFLEAYRAEAPLTAHEIRHGLQAYCGNWCGWLKFNLQRSIGTVASDKAEQELGKREVAGTLILLCSAEQNIPQLASRFP